jgi:chemotaxis protein CheX
MNVQYINPFIEASKKVISQTTELQSTLGKVYVKQAPCKSNNIVVLIGLTGEICGNVIITIGISFACKIASIMMGGTPVPILDEMAKSAISELSNMIMGTTATILYKNNIKIDITPPTILVGDNMSFSNDNAVIVCVPLVFEDGEIIELDISYIDKKKTK